MTSKTAGYLTTAGMIFVSLLTLGGCGTKHAGPHSTLSGTVSSNAEGQMEGVLVSAKRIGGTTTTTVVSNKQGRYTFPAGRLEPGEYAITIRAAGYQASQPEMAVSLGQNGAEYD
ncbi:MAG: carboxypeptidase-like regulatory domain-containing protein, partial [Terriglobia bacterium]